MAAEAIVTLINDVAKNLILAYILSVMLVLMYPNSLPLGIVVGQKLGNDP